VHELDDSELRRSVASTAVVIHNAFITVFVKNQEALNMQEGLPRLTSRGPQQFEHWFFPLNKNVLDYLLSNWTMSPSVNDMRTVLSAQLLDADRLATTHENIKVDRLVKQSKQHFYIRPPH
jgi:hypothetical protein